MPVNLIPQSHLPLRKRFIKEQTFSTRIEANPEPQSNLQGKSQNEGTPEENTKCSSKVNIKTLRELGGTQNFILLVVS